ncbi:hypothetical protein CGLO_05898 [Colletotrichum gloeosporioides Cg-14]|uniref:Uncharacterized protein n=1 Tax=Colletotrichum gloeosporioides (strain Cg-14) TaxID=1237896 RepID=T0KQD6_COLGC|nr:hypothetical protein CGLO_05898 [Colletotrichum gloeosporioides Cg-14]
MTTTSTSPTISPIDGDPPSAPFMRRIPSVSQATDLGANGETKSYDHDQQEVIGDTPPDQQWDTPSRKYARVPSLELATSPTTESAMTELNGFVTPKSDESYNKTRTVPDALEIWSFEIVTLLISVIAFMAIVILLSAYDGRAQPRLYRGININTIIAILSTILKATLVFVVAEVIGQSKWAWMETPQRLRHVEYFHEAGKGAWGALKFLFTIWKPMTTTLGAIVIIASFGIAPFSQQAATTYPCEINAEGTASIAVAQWIGTGTDGRMQVISSETHVSAVTGLIYGPSVSAAAPAGFQCESGNCTFNSIAGITHSSVGICSSCKEVDVHQLKNGTSIVFAFGTMGNDTAPTPNITWPMKENSDVFIMGTNWLYSDYADSSFETSFLALKTVECADKMSSDEKESRHCGQVPWLTSHQTNQGLEAMGAKCRLYPCFRNYNGSIISGRLHEKEVASALVEPCVVNGKIYHASNISVLKHNTRPYTNTQWHMLPTDG